MRGTVSTVLATLALIVAVGVGVTLDMVLPSAEPQAAERTDAGPPESGAWYCTVGDTADGSLLRLVSSVPEVGVTSAALRIDTFRGGEARRLGEIEVLRGDVQETNPVGDDLDRVGLAARWWRTATAVTRTWTRNVTGEPAGIVEGPCENDASDVWYLPGVTTTGGSQARIVLGNPFETDAAVSVELMTPEGLDGPERLKNIGIPRQSIRVITLNEYAPEEPDVGAVVTVRAGRVIAEGWQSADAAVGGIEGVSLLKFATSGAEQWTVPWFQGAGAESWVSVANVSERPAAVNATVHTAEGGTAPDGVDEIIIPPGAVTRIPLEGVLPDGVASGSVSVTSANGAPIVVSGTTRVGAGTAERTGLAVQLGQDRPARRWLVATSAGEGRHEVLHLTNTAAEDAVADVTVLLPGGESAQTDAMRNIKVPPGSTQEVVLDEATGATRVHAIAVDASAGSLVAGLHAFSTDGQLNLVAQSGISGAMWTGGDPVPSVRYDAGLSRRVGTVLGPATTPTPTTIPTSTPTVLPTETSTPPEEPAVTPTGVTPPPEPTAPAG